MNFVVNIAENNVDLINWLTQLQQHSNNFNRKIVSILEVHRSFVQNFDWSVSDKRDKREILEQNVADKLEQKIELFHVQMQESVSKPIQDEFKKLQQTIDVFRGDARVSSSKGKIGELQIENQIETYFPDAEVTDCSKQQHQTDFHLKLHGFTIFIEVKTYQKNVPQKEVDKFYRDLEENPNAQAGVLLSLTSGIANKPMFTYEIHPATKKPIVFVPNAGVFDGTVVWAILFATLVLRYQLQNQLRQTHTGDNNKSNDFEVVLNMVRNQMQWVQLTMDNIVSLKETSLKHFTNLTQEAEHHHKETHRKLEDSAKVLKQNLDIWTDYLANGTTMILPLPSTSQTANSSGNGFVCSGCNKAYKTERHYLTHKQGCLLSQKTQ